MKKVKRKKCHMLREGIGTENQGGKENDKRKRKNHGKVKEKQMF